MKRWLFRGGLTFVLLVAFCLLVIWFYRPGLLLLAPNHGHRLGGDILNTYPENTLEVFRLAIDEIESNRQYQYSECDLRETKDHQIVIFHDADLSRLVPDTPENRSALGVEEIDDSISIEDLTLQQVQNLRLGGGCQIPTLEQFFDCVKETNPQKPILLEIKFLHSEPCCQRVIEMTRDFRDETGFDVNFLAFIYAISYSHSEPRAWLDDFKAAGFRVYQACRPKTPEFDLCETW